MTNITAIHAVWVDEVISSYTIVAEIQSLDLLSFALQAALR